MCTTLTENGNLTPKTTNLRPNHPNSKSRHNAAPKTPQNNQTEIAQTPPEPLSEDPDLHDRPTCHTTKPPQPCRTSRTKPVKTTQKQGMTEGETREMTTFTPTTHIQRTTQCVQHTHLSGSRIKTRQNHTQHKTSTRRTPFWTPPIQHPHETLNVFVKDGRRLQTKTCVEKGFFEK